MPAAGRMPTFTAMDRGKILCWKPLHAALVAQINFLVHMPKSLTSLDAHTADLVEARRRTGDARFKALPEGVEPIEEVLRGAIDHLFLRLQHLGFKSAPSQLALSRKLGEITQVVRLRPGSSNLSGVNVEVSVDVLMKSASLKRWTGCEGTKYASEFLWIKQLGYLSGGRDYFKWQLVDRSAREQELADLLSKIQSLALPAFEAWADKPALASAVFRFTEVDRIDWLIEIALWSGNRAAAEKLVVLYVQNNPQYAPSFSTELARFRSDPSINEPLSCPVSGAAFLVARHSLDVCHDR